MKAVVMEVKGKNAVVLSRDGRFLKMRNNGGLNIGHEVDITNTKVFDIRMFQKAAAVAAAFIFTVGLGSSAYAYYTPYSYINVDINPSIEITANRFDRILKVEAINEDGAKILENEDFKYKTISSAVEEIIKKSAEKGYLKKDDADAVMLTVTGKSGKKLEKVEKKILEAAKEEVSSEGYYADIIIEEVTSKRQEEAKAMDISPGKLVLIEKLHVVDPEVKIEDIKNAPVRDIMKAIKENKKEAKESEKEIKKDNKNDNKNDNKTEGKIENKELNNSENDKKTEVINNSKVENENPQSVEDSKTKNNTESQGKKNDKVDIQGKNKGK